MITADDIKAYIDTAGSDFSQIDFNSAIELAYRRYREVTGAETVDDTDPVVKKALILFAITELAGQVNLYWRGRENAEIIRTRDVAQEIERLLKLKSKPAVRFVPL